jgi:uncharacterized protein YbjQ (UPF0145 family)
MFVCKKCNREYRSKVHLDRKGICGRCINEQVSPTKAGQAEAVRRKREIEGVLVTTESGAVLPVLNRLGIVTGRTALGMNMFKDIAIAARDLVGGRSQTIEDQLKIGTDTAIYEMKKEALELGANAVVAATLDYTEIGGGNRMLFVVAAGTAVQLEKTETEKAKK